MRAHHWPEGSEDLGEAMQAYLIRRLLQIPIGIILLSIIVFTLTRVLPGDAGEARCGAAGNFSQECFEVARRELGLDKPKVEQYWIWLSDFVSGNPGYSSSLRADISTELWGRLSNTLQLGAMSMIMAIIIGVPIGVLSAIRAGKPEDYLARFIAILGLSVPNFWIATIVIILPATWWGTNLAPEWIKLADNPLGHFRVLALPAAIAALAAGAYIARIVRSSMLEMLHSDHVRTARAKGLFERAVVMRHVLRNSMLTLFTILGLQFSGVLAGNVIMEQIFSIPGMGAFLLKGISARDFNIVLSVSTIFAIWFMVITLVVDLMYSWVDPRIRY